MSDYIKSNLNSDETVIKRAEFSVLGAMPNLIITLIILGLGILIFSLESFMRTLFDRLEIDLAEMDGGLLYFFDIFKWLGILVIICGFIPLILSIIRILTSEFAVTDKRIIGKIGLLGRKAVDLRLNKIDEINVKVTLFGKLFNYSTLCISGSGSDYVHTFIGTKNGDEIKKIINEVLDKTH